MGRRNSKPQFPATISNDHFQKEKIEGPVLFDTSSNNGFKKRALVNSLRTLKVVRITITDLHWQPAHLFRIS